MILEGLELLQESMTSTINLASIIFLIFSFMPTIYQFENISYFDHYTLTQFILHKHIQKIDF